MSEEPLPPNIEYRCQRCKLHFRQSSQHTDAGCAMRLERELRCAQYERDDLRKRMWAMLASTIVTTVIVVLFTARSLV